MSVGTLASKLAVVLVLLAGTNVTASAADSGGVLAEAPLQKSGRVA